MPDNQTKITRPERILSYFEQEKAALAVTGVTGIIYNVGLAAGPWFEGQLAQCLYDIMGRHRPFSDMLYLAAAYVLVILTVQAMRFLKRLYVRKFANHVSREMKKILYGNLLRKERRAFLEEGTGAAMTRAVSDVDACVEGMRKFTTEVFDTGVAAVAYLVLLLYYDWRLALLSMIFPPIACVTAEKLKKVVSRNTAACKKSAGRLNGATLDRISNALTYRVFGLEADCGRRYGETLADYERKAVRANVWENAMQPVYQLISMLGVIFILWFGGKNVMGTGWMSWNIAAFTTFLSCFTKLAVKSSKAAKLFNSVQKAQVSWKRIQPLMKAGKTEPQVPAAAPGRLEARHLTFSYQTGRVSGPVLFREVSFQAEPGEIIGVTGPVGCGKSSFGRLFLYEEPFQGQILFDGEDLQKKTPAQRSGIVSYMGHQPELLDTTIAENILLGETGDVRQVLQAVQMEAEVAQMPEGIHTLLGNGGIRLSGGQQARLALARTLYHKTPLIILDDPFSAVDLTTERQIMDSLRTLAGDSILILISHRLELFPTLDQVLWMENGTVTVSDHGALMENQPSYATLFRLQAETDREKPGETGGEARQ